MIFIISPTITTFLKSILQHVDNDEESKNGVSSNRAIFKATAQWWKQRNSFLRPPGSWTGPLRSVQLLSGPLEPHFAGSPLPCWKDVRTVPCIGPREKQLTPPTSNQQGTTTFHQQPGQWVTSAPLGQARQPRLAAACTPTFLPAGTANTHKSQILNISRILRYFFPSKTHQ